MTTELTQPLVSEKKGLDNASRERALLWACAGAALALGALASLGSTEWQSTAWILLLIVVAAWTLPLDWVVLAIAVSMPFQFYFNLPGSAFALRGAVILVFAAAVRLLARRFIRQNWMLFAAAFVFAAAAGALTAPDRFGAFKGIYDWLPVFGSALVAGQVVRTAETRGRLAGFLIGVGVLEAVFGLVQYAIGLDAVVELLRHPVSRWIYQPNLLSERLGDLSFNWVIFDRAAPFGTFINGIDYAIFIASILTLALALLMSGRRHEFGKKTVALLAAVLVMGTALLLTFKGSGGLALAGGVMTLLVLGATNRIGGRSAQSRLTGRTVALGVLFLLAVIVLVLPFTDLIGQRAGFLLLREQGGTGTAGRLEIWQGLVQVFFQRPFFGFGLNNAALFTEPMRTLRYGIVAYNTTTPESGYVSALVETGLVGLAALLAMFAVTLARGFRQVRTSSERALSAGVVAAIVALLLGNLTVSGFTTHQNGMLLGLLIGMVYSEWNLL